MCQILLNRFSASRKNYISIKAISKSYFEILVVNKKHAKPSKNGNTEGPPPIHDF